MTLKRDKDGKPRKDYKRIEYETEIARVVVFGNASCAEAHVVWKDEECA